MFPFHVSVPIRRVPVVVIALIAANLVIYLWSQSLPESAEQVLAFRWGFVPARMRQLVDHKPIVVRLPHGRPVWPLLLPVQQNIVLPPDPWQISLSLLTCMFLHGGWGHVLSNMWFLWLFGAGVEDRLGRAGFIILYLLGGLLASSCQWFVNSQSVMPVIGASGAIATVCGAFVITWPWARVRTLIFLFVLVTFVELPALLVLGGWFLLQVGSAFGLMQNRVGEPIAWWVHVGGFVAGLYLGPLIGGLVGRSDDEEPPPYDMMEEQHPYRFPPQRPENR